MLASLHVKNLALIDEAEVDFTKGLNILTGETGWESPFFWAVLIWRWEKKCPER